uniref:Coiled-coil-helix-coiled-coil-helix domain containing 2 n=1 Tax=Loxodonta africana TaxID=9785 RepID=G3TTC3_LOXAF
MPLGSQSLTSLRGPPASQVHQRRAMPRSAPTSAIGLSAVAPQQSGLVAQMATPTARVIVGSSVTGHAITGGFSGVNNAEPSRPDITCQEPQRAPAYQQQQFGPCRYEMKQFLESAQNQSDLKLCEGFSEILKQCRSANGLV